MAILSPSSLNSKLGDTAANSYVTASEANVYFVYRQNITNWTSKNASQREQVLIQAAREIDMFSFIDDKYYENQSMQFPRNTHSVITGDVATPITSVSFKNTGFTSDTHGAPKSTTNYWKYGSIHITAATPLRETRDIDANNITTDIVTVATAFSSDPTVNSDFIAFEPLYKEIKDAQCEQALYIIDVGDSSSMTKYKNLGANYVKIGDTAVGFVDMKIGKLSMSSISRKLLSRWIKRSRTVLRG